MASFVPPLLDPANPDAIANWAREVADLLNGEISIGEPLATLADGTEGLDTLRPNGVKGHMLGSFVQADTTSAVQSVLFTHNLNVTPKGISAPPAWNDPLNVGWVLVRLQHDDFGAAATGGHAVLWHGGVGSILTANAIELELHLSGHTVNVTHPARWTFWFFPTTR